MFVKLIKMFQNFIKERNIFADKDILENAKIVKKKGRKSGDFGRAFWFPSYFLCRRAARREKFMERRWNQETFEMLLLKERIRTLQEGEILLIRPQEESPDWERGSGMKQNTDSPG